MTNNYIQLKLLDNQWSSTDSTMTIDIALTWKTSAEIHSLTVCMRVCVCVYGHLSGTMDLCPFGSVKSVWVSVSVCMSGSVRMPSVFQLFDLANHHTCDTIARPPLDSLKNQVRLFSTHLTSTVTCEHDSSFHTLIFKNRAWKENKCQFRV